MLKLFVVDDDEDILFVLQYWLRSEGFDVECFNRSKPLFEAINTTIPHIILLDVNLHGEDGREICKRLKQDSQLDCPVILCSANPMMKLNYKECLANDFIDKPFDLNQLRDRIVSYIDAR